MGKEWGRLRLLEPSPEELRQINLVLGELVARGSFGWSAGLGFHISAAPAWSMEAVGLLRAGGTFSLCINPRNWELGSSVWSQRGSAWEMAVITMAKILSQLGTPGS